MSQKIALAEALLRRKELQNKVASVRQIDQAVFYEHRVKRVRVDEGIDEVVADIPKLTASQVTQELDFHSRQLRMIDAAIQRANWETQVEIPDSVMADYKPPKE